MDGITDIIKKNILENLINTDKTTRKWKKRIKKLNKRVNKLKDRIENLEKIYKRKRGVKNEQSI